jgi:hypothetical protein
MTTEPSHRAMTMQEIREQLGHDKSPCPYVQMTRYEVSLLPPGDINRRYFTLYVEARGDDSWAVTNGFRECLDATGEWSHESLPSGRADEWLATHRFDLSAALRLAKKHAPLMTINGITAVEALRRSTVEATR